MLKSVMEAVERDPTAMRHDVRSLQEAEEVVATLFLDWHIGLWRTRIERIFAMIYHGVLNDGTRLEQNCRAELFRTCAALAEEWGRTEEFLAALTGLLDRSEFWGDGAVYEYLTAQAVNPSAAWKGSVLSPLDWWKLRIRRYIRSGDFRRAWDEMGRAVNRDRLNPLSLRPLLSELYEAMTTKGIIPAIEGTVQLGSVYPSGDSFETFQNSLIGKYRRPDTAHEGTVMGALLEYFQRKRRGVRERKLRRRQN